MVEEEEAAKIKMKETQNIQNVEDFYTTKEMKIEEKKQGNINVMIGPCKTGIF